MGCDGMRWDAMRWHALQWGASRDAEEAEEAEAEDSRFEIRDSRSSFHSLSLTHFVSAPPSRSGCEYRCGEKVRAKQP